MPFPTGCFRHSPGLRVRPVPELETCIVFTPASPRLYRLNLNAWLILELCSGETRPGLEEAYADAVGNGVTPDERRQQLQEGLDLLLGSGIIIDDGNAGGSTG